MLTRLGPEKMILNNAGKTTKKKYWKTLHHWIILSRARSLDASISDAPFLRLAGRNDLAPSQRSSGQPLGTFGGFPKWPKKTNHPALYNAIFHCKPSILGYPLLGNLVWVMWKTPRVTLKPDEREYHCEHPKFPTQTIRELFPEYDA